ncbi:MAG: hypothetical protein K5784_00645 [Clostridiales bacterium]|nr:hypothetical protein [Clostridiales bacterium]
MDYEEFRNPPAGYGEVAFFWWNGDPVTKEKLTWILDRLKDHHISGLQVNYCHTDTGGRAWGLTMPSDPKPLSEEWWQLFAWFMREAGRRGMSVSLSDYTLSTPGQESYTDEVLRAHPEFAGQMLVLETDSEKLNKEYYDTEKLGRTPSGAIWRVHVPWSLNPMAAGSGSTVADAFYGEFERRMPGSCGKGLNYFFSDELEFNVRGRLWCDDFPQEFLKRKGYDLLPLLADLFEDGSASAVKTRLDYYDVIVQLSGERFFRPVYEWHQKRGMTFGCDHGGRGKDVTEFGDYFRAMRWYQGPGNDQPGLRSDIIKSKVSSSAAHLYERPRVWLEGFYSSGWQTSSGDVADAVFRNFALGHNLLSLHGLYYSTHGSYWEWAPPCNHHHMPYWQEMGALLGCVERLSRLLSRGKHVCDVAIVYPVAAVEADPVRGGEAVACAFETAEYLYTHGVDFDFIDFESIERSEVRDGCLSVAGENYHTVILPNMQAARFGMIAKLDEFAQSGGNAVVLGEAPRASDRVAGSDPLFDTHVQNILERHAPLANAEEFYNEYRTSAVPDIVFPPEAEKKYFLHRRIDGEELYYVYGVPSGAVCGFRAARQPVLLDPFTGGRYALNSYRYDGTHTYIPMTDRFAGLMLVLFAKDTSGALPLPEGKKCVIPFSGEWTSELEPTLDNTFGDYRLPVKEKMIGAEARDYDYGFEGDENRYHAVYSYAPYLYMADGDFDEDDISGLKAPDGRFSPYSFSMRYGVEGDAGDQGSYHGLKGRISDDFIAMGKKTVTKAGSSSVYEGEGPMYVMGFVRTDRKETLVMDCGALLPDRIWIDGRMTELGEITLEKGLHAVMLKYACAGRTHFVLVKKHGVPFTQTLPLAMKWYEDPNVIPFIPQPWHEGKACTFSFKAPPGTEGLILPGGMRGRVDCGGAVWQREGDVYRPPVPMQRCAEITVTVDGSDAVFGSALMKEPVRFICGQGIIDADLPIEQQGLKHYSGGVRYTKTVRLNEVKGRVALSFRRLDCACVISVNGVLAATLVAPPYEADITKFVKAGDNLIEVTVHNTLRNHMRTVPTNFLFDKSPGGR